MDKICQAALNANVPKYKRSAKQKMQMQVEKLKNRRNKLQLKNQLPDIRDKNKHENNKNIADLNKEIKAKLDKEMEDKENKAIKSIKDNPAEFYKYAKKYRKTKDKIGPLRCGDTYESDPKSMAEILSCQFKTAFSTPTTNLNEINFPDRECQSINDIEITKEAIKEAMKEIKASSAPGPDELPAYVYNEFADELAHPAMLIWRKSLNSGTMPDGTLLSLITPIFKGGDKGNPINYRPISLTNHLIKVFERVLRKALVNHLESNGFINITQHGFKKGHSTITQLLAYYDSILTMLEEQQEVDVIYLDLAKAFDKVDHNILLLKLQKLGIKGKVHKWIEQFIKNRKQQVRVNNVLSTKHWVISGVPQGSVLGPLLFIVMMIDIDVSIKNAMLGSYADDTKLWQVIKNQHLLQQDLQSIYQWIETNNMMLNGEKFEHLHYGRTATENINIYTTHTGENIKHTQQVKDLGVTMSSDAKFSTHITNMVAQAQKLSAWILRTFKTRQTYPMITLLKSLLIPTLEYACIIWSPNETHHIQLIENVLRRFTRRIGVFNNNANNQNLNLSICTTDYWQRLKFLKLYSLERRRERYLILYMYKIIIGIHPNPGFEVTDFTHNPRTGIKVLPKFKKNAPCWVKTIRSSSFFTKGPMLYNLLPVELRTEENLVEPTKANVQNFKQKLDKFLVTIPDQPTTTGLQRQAQSNSLIHQLMYRTI